LSRHGASVRSEEELVESATQCTSSWKVFWSLVDAYEPGKRKAEIMAPAVERFFARGAGPRMMNIVLSGAHGQAEAHFKVPGQRAVAGDDLLLYSWQITARALLG